MLIWPAGVSDLKGPLGKVPCDGERAVAHDRNCQGHARDCAANFVYDIIKTFITIIEALSRSLQCCLESRPPLEKHLGLVIWCRGVKGVERSAEKIVNDVFHVPNGTNDLDIYSDGAFRRPGYRTPILAVRYVELNAFPSIPGFPLG